MREDVLVVLVAVLDDRRISIFMCCAWPALVVVKARAHRNRTMLAARASVASDDTPVSLIAAGMVGRHSEGCN